MNELTQVKDNSGVIASHTYYDQGRRISLSAWGETSKFYYSGDKVIYTTCDKGTADCAKMKIEY